MRSTYTSKHTQQPFQYRKHYKHTKSIPSSPKSPNISKIQKTYLFVDVGDAREEDEMPKMEMNQNELTKK